MLVQLRPANPAFGLALDEAILAKSRERFTLRLWRNELSVVIGRSQRIRDEVDLQRCQAENIPIFRRCSGGGTVLHYPGNLNISLIVTGEKERQTVDQFDAACGQALARAVRRLCVECRYERNALFTEDGSRKLSGAAQAIRSARRLYHATLLLSPPPLPMSSVLRAMQPGYSPLGPPSRPRELASIDDLLRARCSVPATLRAGVEGGMGLVTLVIEIVRSFAAMLGFTIDPGLARGIEHDLNGDPTHEPHGALDAVPRLGTITAEERVWAEHLEHTKYAESTWTHRR